MNNNIKVSIVVPVYNAQKYLRTCVDSLVHQTLEELEIILINDGSTDESPFIMREYEKQYPDKVICIHKENGGQASARNMGIEISRGTYVGFVDADDYVDLTMFEKMYRNTDSECMDMVACDYEYIEYASGNHLTQYAKVKQIADKKEMFIDPLVSPWNKLYRRQILKDTGVLFREGCVYEDTAFYMNLIPYIEKTKFVSEKLVYHYKHVSSTMNGVQTAKVADMFTILEDIQQYYKEQDIWNEYKSELEYFSVKILLCSSFERVTCIKDKKLRKMLLEKTWKIIQENYGEYRKNIYLNDMGSKGRKLYMKSFSKGRIYMWCWLFRLRKK